MNYLWPTIMGKKTNRISPLVLKPASSAVGSDGSFLFAAYTRKDVVFAHRTSPLPGVLASQDTGHHQIWRAYAPLSWESSLPSLLAVRGLCLEVWLGTWDDPFLEHVFMIGNDLLFCITKR